MPTITRCACGNAATEPGGTCSWCIPHEHDAPARPHDFSWPAGICSRCRFMAQDCCEAASECEGVTIWGTPVRLVDTEEYCALCEHSTYPDEDGSLHYQGCPLN